MMTTSLKTVFCLEIPAFAALGGSPHSVRPEVNANSGLNTTIIVCATIIRLILFCQNTCKKKWATHQWEDVKT